MNNNQKSLLHEINNVGKMGYNDYNANPMPTAPFTVPKPVTPPINIPALMNTLAPIHIMRYFQNLAQNNTPQMAKPTMNPVAAVPQNLIKSPRF